ncbi:MAG: hypothetical protein UV65_C0018G0005 [Parcubacteria group bacterium GW2011_GWF2_43_11]|nr:MAG: hypothetical protein UV65_C0018G0005 [Parcubacteria group bacterium GW2011_GWF2_43_11]
MENKIPLSWEIEPNKEEVRVGPEKNGLATLRSRISAMAGDVLFGGFPVAAIMTILFIIFVIPIAKSGDWAAARGQLDQITQKTHYVNSAIIFIYFWFLTGSYGWTLGKRYADIKVVEAGTLNKVGLKRAFLREGSKILLNSIPFVAYVIIFLNIYLVSRTPKRQAIHDKIARTQVITIPRDEKKRETLKLTALVLAILLFTSWGILAWQYWPLLSKGSPAGIGTGQKISIVDWTGIYEYSEFAPPNQTWVYKLEIYKEGNQLKAQLDIDGFQTLTRIQAIAKENDGNLDIIFDSYLSESGGELYKKGDLLFNLEKISEENYKIIWNKLQSNLLEPGEAKFEKIAAAWNTYRNRENGFEVKYPNVDWEVIEGVGFDKKDLNTCMGLGCEVPGIIIEPHPNEDIENFWIWEIIKGMEISPEQFKLINREKLIISNREITKAFFSGGEGINKKYVYIFNSPEINGFTLFQIVIKNNGIDYQSVAEKMLSTFRFLK